MSMLKTDVLVIGSGFGAAAPALRLAEAGFRVRVIEKGPNVRAPADFQQTQDPKYVLRYLHGLSGDNIGVTYAEALGGGSGFYEMVSLRAPSLVFEQTGDDGQRLWPAAVDRATLDPYYDIAEAMLNVEQIAADDVPKSGLVFSLLMRNLGLSCDRARYAVRGCVGSGFCVTGCIYGAKQSLHMNYLPQAVEAGATIETDLEALWIRTLRHSTRTRSTGPLRALPFRYEVICRERQGRRRYRRYQARLVVLAGGTVGTAALLLRSRRYLPRLSEQVGRNMAFNGSVKVAGLLPEGFPEGDMFAGRSHPGMISYHFLESHGVTVAAAKPLPLQAIAAARLKLDGDTRAPAHWGAAHVELMKLYRRRVLVLFALGLTPPVAEMSLNGDKPRVGLHLDRRLRSYYKRTRRLLRSIFERNGCQLLDPTFVDGEGRPHDDLFFSTAHHVGSCRMADSKALGVASAAGEVFEYPGLYISDGSLIPSSLAVNTSLTILANAERIAAGLVDRYGMRRPSIQKEIAAPARMRAGTATHYTGRQ